MGMERVDSQQNSVRKPQDFRNSFQISDVLKDAKVQNEEFLKSKTARLHPFCHSLVSQNYEIINRQMKDEERNFMLASPQHFINSSMFQEFKTPKGIAVNSRSHQRNDHRIMSHSSMHRNESNNFNLRSQLSPVTQVPTDIHSSTFKIKCVP